MEEHKIMDSLLQIIFNVMKTISKEDLGKLKHLFQDVEGVKMGTPPPHQAKQANRSEKCRCLTP